MIYGSPGKLVEMMADDIRVIPYRPRLNKLTNSVKATILLQQCIYWGKIKFKEGEDEFFKFREPCGNKLYKEGDSWTEELGFSPAEFDTAIKKIGYKRGENKDKNKIKTEEEAYVIYYTEGKRMTWHILNWNKINQDLNTIYKLNEESQFTKENRENGITKENKENKNTIITEITSKTTTKKNNGDDEKILETYKEVTGKDLTRKELQELKQLNNDEQTIIDTINNDIKHHIKGITNPFSYLKKVIKDKAYKSNSKNRRRENFKIVKKYLKRKKKKFK